MAQVGISVTARYEKSNGRDTLAEFTVRPFKNEEQQHFSHRKLADCLKNVYGHSPRQWGPNGDMTACVKLWESVSSFEESDMLKALIDCYPGWRLRMVEQDSATSELTPPLWGQIPIIADRQAADLLPEQFAQIASSIFENGRLRRLATAAEPPAVGNELFESVAGSVNDPLFQQLLFPPDPDLPF